MPDPKLKTAMEEIKAVISKHDIAAQVTLISPSHREFLYEISPSWSCAKLVPGDGDESFFVRVNTRSESYPTAEAKRIVITNTLSMFFAIRNQAEQTVEQMDTLLNALSSKIDSVNWERKE